MTLSFEGKTVVVTGAGGTIGRSYALAYAQRGANVVVNDLNDEAAQRVVQEIITAGGNAVKDTHSVTDGPAIIRTALDAYDGVHILINNAGTAHLTKFADFTDKQWDSLVEVHLQGTISCTQAVWPLFCTQGSGHIVNTTSSAGLYGFEDNCAYSAGKAGIIAFTKAVAKEGVHFGVTANAIAPFAYSQMTELIIPEKAWKSLTPDFIAPLVLALTHGESGPSATGRLFEVAAGWISEVKSARVQGVLFRADKPLTPAAVQERWNDIAPDFTDRASKEAGDLCYDGLTVLVTGSTTELGRSYARLFASLGANLVASDSDATQLRYLVQDIVQDGGKAVAAIAASDDADAIVQAAIKAYGSIHVLVTNADVSPTGILPQISDEEWEQSIKEQLHAAYKASLARITKACWPIFKSQNYGRVVYTSSTAGLNGAENKVPFSSAKGALLGFARAIGYEGKPQNILVNTVMPSDAKQLDASSVSAVVGFLASKANTGIARAVIEVIGSWVGQSQWLRTGGHMFYHDEELTPEAVIDKWDSITDFDDGRATHPSAVSDSVAAAFANFANISGKGAGVKVTFDGRSLSRALL
ncbi:NAD(P)-binding protein [Auricularia subglabra TFB-10046 SS5]|nr:NAD(P)-binding protein [Auricularia subglabra TFB-10046 SS5]